MSMQSLIPGDNPESAANAAINLQISPSPQAQSPPDATPAIKALKDFLVGIAKSESLKALELLELALVEQAQLTEDATLHEFTPAALEDLITRSVSKTLAELRSPQK